MNENKPLVEVQGLKMHFSVAGKGFGKKSKQTLKAVDDVTLSSPAGTTFGLVGESGCGKTTVGRTILKLYKPTGGKIFFDGQDITDLSEKEFSPYRKDMQMIFQDPYASLDPRQTVNEIIGAPLLVQKLVASKKERDERVRELVHMVGLKDDHINRYPHEFSGGQRQRIGIARALALKPRFIVCDEPISALDVSIQAQVVNILEDFQEEMGLTYLFISHDLSMVRHISHRVGVMYLGHLVEVADVAELFENKRIILEGDVPSPMNPPSGCPFRTRCRYATAECAQAMPPLTDIGNNHQVACYHML